MSRTSVLMSRVSPTRRISRTWMARSSFTWSRAGISVISSRKRVPALGGGEETDLVGDRAGERALHVPEELGLHQPLGDGSAVDGDERLVAPVAVEVDGAGHQLLAGAALARDHDGGRAVGDLADGVEHLDHPAALADDVLEAVLGLELLPEVEVLVAELLALERVPDDEVDFVELERLGDVVVGAELHRLHRGLGRGHRGDHDDRGVGGDLLGGAQHLQPVHLRHAQIGDDHVEGLAAERFDGGLRPPSASVTS